MKRAYATQDEAVVTVETTSGADGVIVRIAATDSSPTISSVAAGGVIDRDLATARPAMDGEHCAVVARAADGTLLITVDGITRPAHVSVEGRRAWLTSGKATTSVERIERKRRGGGQDGGSSVVAPMTGRVVAVHAVVGAAVKRGDVLVVIEAMKMEQPLSAPRDGIVEAVRCAPGQLVDGGVVLVAMVKEVA